MNHFRQKIVDRILLLATGLAITFGVLIYSFTQSRFDYIDGFWQVTAAHITAVPLMVLFLTRKYPQPIKVKSYGQMDILLRVLLRNTKLLYR